MKWTPLAPCFSKLVHKNLCWRCVSFFLKGAAILFKILWCTPWNPRWKFSLAPREVCPFHSCIDWALTLSPSQMTALFTTAQFRLWLCSSNWDQGWARIRKTVICLNSWFVVNLGAWGGHFIAQCIDKSKTAKNSLIHIHREASIQMNTNWQISNIWLILQFAFQFVPTCSRDYWVIHLWKYFEEMTSALPQIFLSLPQFCMMHNSSTTRLCLGHWVARCDFWFFKTSSFMPSALFSWRAGGETAPCYVPVSVAL